MTNKEAINFLRGKLKLLGELNCVYSEEDYALDMAIKALERQEKEKWIPVSERLPDEREEEDESGLDETYMTSDLVLVTVVDDEKNTFVSDDIIVDGEWVNFGDFNYCRVIAWKPMPEMYGADVLNLKML